VLVKRSPFTAADVARSKEFTEQYGFETLWAPPVGVEFRPPPAEFADYTALVRSILTERDRAKMFRDAPFDISLATDDNPFYFVERARPGQRAGVGVLQLQTLFGALLVLIIPFLLLPLVSTFRRGSEEPAGQPALGVAAAIAYFSLIGVGFMGVEIEMFHVFALLLGSPIVTFSVVLAGLLLSSGVGSYAAGRLQHSHAAAAGVFVALLALLAVFLLTRGYLLSSVVAAPMAARVGATLLIVAPLGFLMGMPMPLGMSQVAGSPRLVLWGWSLNGVFSVLASVGAIYCAIYWGTTRTFMLAAVTYLLAGLMLQVLRRHAVPATLSPA